MGKKVKSKAEVEIQLKPYLALELCWIVIVIVIAIIKTITLSNFNEIITLKYDIKAKQCILFNLQVKEVEERWL